MKMSNIANQLVAVVATLLGFVAHDVLSERQVVDAATNVALADAIDPIVTRSVDLAGSSVEHFLDMSTRAERVALSAPTSRLTAGTAPAHLDRNEVETSFADISVNAARSIAPLQQADLNALR
jgi:hypothetical protein